VSKQDQYSDTLNNNDMLTTFTCDCTRHVHLLGHNNTNGTWCQGHTRKLLVKCRTRHHFTPTQWNM